VSWLAKKGEHEIEGKKLKFISVLKPLSRRSKWTEYDDDLDMFAKVEMDDYWNVVVPEGVDAKKLRDGLRSRIRMRFKGEIRLVSKKDASGKMLLQLQKVKHGKGK